MKTRILIGLIGITVLSSCSSYNYYAVSNKPLDNEKYRTFAWIPEGKSKSTSIYDNDIATDKIVASATAEMTKRGFTLKNRQPDLLLRYTAVVKRGVREIYDPVYYNSPMAFYPRMGYYRGRGAYYYGYMDRFPIYVGNRERSIRIKENSIVIDMIDRKSSRVIWRGWAEGELDNPEKAIKELPVVIGNIFKKLP